MIISHIKMKNWRNFRNVDTPLERRMFLVGANASGKSNFLAAYAHGLHFVGPAAS